MKKVEEEVKKKRKKGRKKEKRRNYSAPLTGNSKTTSFPVNFRYVAEKVSNLYSRAV